MSEPVFPPEVPQVGQWIKITFEGARTPLDARVSGRMEVIGNTFFIALFGTPDHLEYFPKDKKWLYFYSKAKGSMKNIRVSI